MKGERSRSDGAHLAIPFVGCKAHLASISFSDVHIPVSFLTMQLISQHFESCRPNDLQFMWPFNHTFIWIYVPSILMFSYGLVTVTRAIFHPPDRPVPLHPPPSSFLDVEWLSRNGYSEVRLFDGPEVRSVRRCWDQQLRAHSTTPSILLAFARFSLFTLPPTISLDKSSSSRMLQAGCLYSKARTRPSHFSSWSCGSLA